MKSTAAKRKIQKALLGWFDTEQRDMPWRRTGNPYPIWVSEIMLQQTQVKTVIPYFERWMKSFPTLQKLARAREDTVLKHWEGLGYYSRARNLHRAAKLVIKEHKGKVPDNYDSLIKLPGIGRYTAGAILSIAFNQPYRCWTATSSGCCRACSPCRVMASLPPMKTGSGKRQQNWYLRKDRAISIRR